MVHAGCVFVAEIFPSRTWMSGSLESVRGNACVHRLDLGLYFHLKVFLGNGVRTHVNSKGKNLIYWRLRGGLNLRRCITQDSEPNTLPIKLVHSQADSLTLARQIFYFLYTLIVEAIFLVMCVCVCACTHVCARVCVCVCVCAKRFVLLSLFSCCCFRSWSVRKMWWWYATRQCAAVSWPTSRTSQQVGWFWFGLWCCWPVLSVCFVTLMSFPAVTMLSFIGQSLGVLCLPQTLLDGWFSVFHPANVQSFPLRGALC